LDANSQRAQGGSSTSTTSLLLVVAMVMAPFSPGEDRAQAIRAHRASANPRWWLAGIAGLLLTGSHNGAGRDDSRPPGRDPSPRANTS